MTRTRIIRPEEAKKLALDPTAPVLFVYSDWRMIYRRLPPSFSKNQLRVGVVAKIIPFEQVLSGNGTLALRTAAWEETCSFRADDGNYIDLDRWEAEGGAMLYRAIDAAQKYCGLKLSNDFQKLRELP